MRPAPGVVTSKSFGLADSIINHNNVADSQTMTWGRRRMIAARLFGVVLAGVLMTGASPVAAQPTTGKPQAGSTTRAVELVVQSGHTAEIRALEYARSGRFFATAGKDSTIRIWSPGGALIRTIVTRFWAGALVFSAAHAGELSFESPKIQNGVFTWEIVDALVSGKADVNRDGTITLDELQAYVSRNVAVKTGGLQRPTMDRDNIHQRFGFPVLR